EPIIRLIRETSEIIKQKLELPNGYEVAFLTSATEIWSVIAESLASDETWIVKTGAFAEKWEQQIRYFQANVFSCTANELLSDSHSSPSLIALVQSETSNGSQLPNDYLVEVRRRFPDAWIAVDATSSLGGLCLPYEKADLWFASVQKCFGLPSGLAILIFSERIKNYVLESKSQLKKYNALSSIFRMAEDFQTINTPNVLGIYCLQKVLKHRKSISYVDNELRKREQVFWQQVSRFPIQPFNRVAEFRLPTVFCCIASEQNLRSILVTCAENGMIVGKGYGKLAETTFRVANFPQHNEEQFERLFTILSTIQFC
ncbi:MAG: aminotransferase class V-fold PLP-dependent enzyme, partial [Bacteroidia bacterium]|nr:aminotransferase class V-fold PLP-dependent enzyme [Bacteroidia bacterium]